MPRHTTKVLVTGTCVIACDTNYHIHWGRLALFRLAPSRSNPLRLASARSIPSSVEEVLEVIGLAFHVEAHKMTFFL